MKFKRWLLSEAKKDIIFLGFPEVIASLLKEKFNQNADLIAKWLKEYQSIVTRTMTVNFDFNSENKRLNEFVHLYENSDTPENYIRACQELELSCDDEIIDDYYLLDQKRELKIEIKEYFFKLMFFDYEIIEDIINKKLTDLSPYKNIGFFESKDKYSERKVFNQRTIIKSYGNGYKWIDVGNKCSIVGKLMKNCGRSSDGNMIVLFDSNNKPHVIVTYLSHLHKIKNIKGQAGSTVKEEYQKYLIDLKDTLKANLEEK
jgi:hypothetical protein